MPIYLEHTLPKSSMNVGTTLKYQLGELTKKLFFFKSLSDFLKKISWLHLLFSIQNIRAELFDPGKWEF